MEGTAVPSIFILVTSRWEGIFKEKGNISFPLKSFPLIESPPECPNSGSLYLRCKRIVGDDLYLGVEVGSLLKLNREEDGYSDFSFFELSDFSTSSANTTGVKTGETFVVLGFSLFVWETLNKAGENPRSISENLTVVLHRPITNSCSLFCYGNSDSCVDSKIKLMGKDQFDLFFCRLA